MDARACVRTNIINLRRKIKCVPISLAPLNAGLMPLAMVHGECRNIFYAYKERATLQRQKKNRRVLCSHMHSGIPKDSRSSRVYTHNIFNRSYLHFCLFSDFFLWTYGSVDVCKYNYFALQTNAI